jgi:hypothetical protein
MNKVVMERRRHPTHDREQLRQIAIVLLVVVVALGIAALGARLQSEWLKVVAIVVFFAGMGFLLVKARWQNVTPCPECQLTLRRAPDSTEFTCTNCQIVWWTRCYGSSVWD